MNSFIENDVTAISRIDAVNLILKSLRRITGMRVSMVVRLTSDSWTACAVQDEAGMNFKVGDQLELSNTYWNTIRGAVAPLMVNHASREEQFKNHPALMHYGVESFVGVPLFKTNGELFGTLCALDFEPKEVSEDVIEIFELFGNLIALELEFDDQAREKEEALKLAEQSSESRARFMSILGHDLRSPLNTIMMAASVQKMQNISPEKNIELAETITKTAKRMQYLIEDLLDTTQILQGNKILIEKKDIDLSKICQQIIKEFELANSKLNIEFFAQGNCIGKWDEGRLGQVLSNLLSNAIHYGDIRKPIKVDLIEDCGEVVLQVNNQGSMITEEMKKNLFTPFWRGAKKQANSSGLGLGLYVVKQIVESHGGEISVESTPEYGTTFIVKFKDDSN